MKKWLLAIILVLSMVGLAACGSDDKESSGAEAKNKLQQIQEKGIITIGLEGTFPPFSYHEVSGELTGFEFELAEQIAKDLGVEAKYVETK